MEDKTEIEPSLQQLNQLNQLEKFVQLKHLRGKCEKFKSDFEYVQNERKQQLQTLEQLKKRLGNVKEEVKKANLEEIVVKEKLASVLKSLEKPENSLENLCLFLGFQISKLHLLSLYKTDKTLLYENGLDVTYNEIKKLYKLVASYPHHPEMEKIRIFLEKLADLEGVLHNLKQMVDPELKEAEQNN